MALQAAFTLGKFVLELDGKMAGFLAGAEVGAIKAEAVDLTMAADIYTKKAIGNAEYADCTITNGAAEIQPQLDWIGSIWRKDVMEKSGAIILADHNFKERRRATFTGASIIDVKLDDLDAGNNKKPYQLTYKFAPEHLEYTSGTGAVIKGDASPSQKQWKPSNFRIKMGGLPCDFVTKVSGLQITSEVAKEYHGSFRFPTRHQANLKFADLKIEVSGEEKAFTEWNKFAKMTLVDGVCNESEELNCMIEWLTPDLKKTIGTLNLVGCGLKEFSMPKFDGGKSGMANFSATFMVETWDQDGFKFA